MNKLTLIKKIREIIKKHNDEDRYQGISTLAPAKEIADYVIKRFGRGAK